MATRPAPAPARSRPSRATRSASAARCSTCTSRSPGSSTRSCPPTVWPSRPRTVRARVEAARAHQWTRFAGTRATSNADMGVKEVRQHCGLDASGETLLRAAVQQLGLSARAYHRVLKVARTIADLASAERIQPSHLA